MSGQPDIADIIYDPRMEPPAPEGYTWQPEPGKESAYYEACTERRRGEIDYDPECPVCHNPYPNHGRSCFVAGDFGPSYRLVPSDFDPYPQWEE